MPRHAPSISHTCAHAPRGRAGRDTLDTWSTHDRDDTAHVSTSHLFIHFIHCAYDATRTVGEGGFGLLYKTLARNQLDNQQQTRMAIVRSPRATMRATLPSPNSQNSHKTAVRVPRTYVGIMLGSQIQRPIKARAQWTPAAAADAAAVPCSAQPACRPSRPAVRCVR